MGKKVQDSVRGGWGYPDSGREVDMPIQDLFSAAAKQEKLQQDKAIVSAVVRYFETAPSRVKSPAGVVEESIINALHRYFAKKP